jgi:hypothetical protein
MGLEEPGDDSGAAECVHDTETALAEAAFDPLHRLCRRLPDYCLSSSYLLLPDCFLLS